jgi:hypothetical protein
VNSGQNHFVTLFSNASQKICPDNKLSAFTVQLSKTIELESTDKWEVGVCELTCPPPKTVIYIYIYIYMNTMVIGDTKALIYCDVISPQFICSSLARCLRKYITPNTHCQHISENNHYLPVEKGNFRIIRI